MKVTKSDLENTIASQIIKISAMKTELIMHKLIKKEQRIINQLETRLERSKLVVKYLMATYRET